MAALLIWRKIKMEIKQNLVETGKYSIKCPYSREPQFYVVHNTYNDASAKNEIAYMIRNDSKVSFHWAIDDVEAVQGLPEDRSAFASGDGGKGQGNLYGIHVEICYSKSGGDRFNIAEQNAAKFIADGLKAHGWGIDKVKKHQDFANKYCPHRTLDMGWERFLNMVKTCLDGDQTVVTPTPTPQPSKPSGNELIKAGQQHSINFTGHTISCDGIRGSNTKANARRCVQVACNLDYGAGLVIDGDFKTKSKNALGDHCVKKGETQYLVTALEILLMLKGYNPSGVECPGKFGSGLEACLLQYQKDAGLKQDKVAGKNTFYSLMDI